MLADDARAVTGPAPRSWWQVPVLRYRVGVRAVATVTWAPISLPVVWTSVQGLGWRIFLTVVIVAVAALGLGGVRVARREHRDLLEGQAVRTPYRKDGERHLLLAPAEVPLCRVEADRELLAALPASGSAWVRGNLAGGPAALEVDRDQPEPLRLWLLGGGARLLGP